MYLVKQKGCRENHEKINYLGPLHNTGKNLSIQREILKTDYNREILEKCIFFLTLHCLSHLSSKKVPEDLQVLYLCKFECGVNFLQLILNQMCCPSLPV